MTTVKQIQDRAFVEIMMQLDFTVKHATTMPFGRDRRSVVLEKTSFINTLIFLFSQIGALNAEQIHELKRINSFVDDSWGEHHGACSSIAHRLK